MVDIHSHILPAIDDGARTLDESIQMLQIAARSGTTDIVATPHASTEFPYDTARIQDAYKCLRDAAAGLIHVHLGCDFHLSYTNLLAAFAEPEKYTINQTRYLLLELPDLISFTVVTDALNSLIHARFTPIITHPERNLTLRSNPQHLRAWTRSGCLLQVTAQSFTGRFGVDVKRFADKLLKADLVHFVASDAHDCSNRPPDLLPAFKYIAQARNQRAAEALFTYNPAAALHGEPIPQTRKIHRRRFGFWTKRAE